MRNIRNIATAMLMAAAFILGTGRTQAQPTTLNFNLTATYQLPDTNNAAGNLTISATKSVRWTSATLVSLLTNGLGASYPKGSYLAQDNGSVEVIMDKAGDSTNVDQFVTFNTGGTQVNAGTANSTTSQQSTVSLIYVTASFNDNAGNAFTVDGILRQTISISAVDANGNQNESISFSGNVAGSGSVVDKNGNTDAAIFTGVISGAGKGPVGS
jgi:hypothetical protein